MPRAGRSVWAAQRAIAELRRRLERWAASGSAPAMEVPPADRPHSPNRRVERAALGRAGNDRTMIAGPAAGTAGNARRHSAAGQ
jgi:hypothetical protein